MEKWIIEIKVDGQWIMAKTPEGVTYGEFDTDQQAQAVAAHQYSKVLAMQAKDPRMPEAVRVVCVEIVAKSN